MKVPLQVVASRWYAAAPPSVYRAFTEPALLEQWFCPSDDTTLKVEHCDVRVGGTYRFVFTFADGSVVPVLGEYKLVEPPQRLRFTWTWEAPNPWASVVTLVTVTFTARRGGTDVQVDHREFATEDMKKTHESGWPATLERLSPVLGGSSS